MEYVKKLVGDRLFLSPRIASNEEVERFTTWLNDFQITDYIGRSSNIVTYNGEKEYLENSDKNSNDINFNIVELNRNKLNKPRLLGAISLKDIDWVNRSAELGIFIGDKEFRNKGYGTEAINLLLEYGFKYINLNSIKLSLLDVNERAHKCYLNCGFKDSGYDRNAIFLNGKYHNKLHMDILASEFKGIFIRNKNV